MVGHVALVAWWLTWLATRWSSLRSPSVSRAGVAGSGMARADLLQRRVLVICWTCHARSASLRAPSALGLVVKHETAYSYPSSHAAIAAGFLPAVGRVVALASRSARARSGGARRCLAFAGRASR